MDKLDEVVEFLSSIPNINNGGCGIAAITVKRVIPDRVKSIVALYREFDEWEFQNDAINMSNGSVENVAEHYAIRLEDGTVIDSFGEIDKTEYPYELDIISEDMMINILNDGCWNDMFSRNEWIPTIENRFGIFLSDILQ